jgi:hypothetical protein
LDTAEPPRIVFDSPAPCADAGRAAELLRTDLATTRGLGPGWTVRVHVDRDNAGRLVADGTIADASGTAVAHRSLTTDTGECVGLARAFGVWAGLVLDARAAGTEAASSDAGSSTASVAAAVPVTGSSESVSWPAPAATDPPTPEHDWYLHHEDTKSLELGAGMFLMTGTGGGALAGPVAFGVIEVPHGIFLRPALAFGEAMTSLPPSDLKSSTWAAARVDACLRLPGLYTRRHGMQLDLCAGAEGGYTRVEAAVGTTLPYVDLGPSFDLRGELGGSFSAVLRMVAGVELVRQSFEDLSGSTEQPPLVTGRLELALSWDAR